MLKFNYSLVGAVAILAMLLGSITLHGQTGQTRHGFRYSVALIQGGGRNRGILEMAGTVSVSSDSAVTVDLKKAHVAKLLAGQELFRPTQDCELVFRKDNEGRWTLENGGTDPREFTPLLAMIVGLEQVQATGKAPETLPGIVGQGVVEKKHAGWERGGPLFVLRDSPHNGLVLKSSAEVLQGIKIGSNGQFDQLKDCFAHEVVDLRLLEDLVSHSKTDHLELSVVTLTK